MSTGRLASTIIWRYSRLPHAAALDFPQHTDGLYKLAEIAFQKIPYMNGESTATARNEISRKIGRNTLAGSSNSSPPRSGSTRGLYVVGSPRGQARGRGGGSRLQKMFRGQQ